MNKTVIGPSGADPRMFLSEGPSKIKLTADTMLKQISAPVNIISSKLICGNPFSGSLSDSNLNDKANSREMT